MSVLVLVEHDGSHIKDATLATVTAAAQLGDVSALVVGNNVEAVAQAAAKIAGVSKVLLADAARGEGGGGAPIGRVALDHHDLAAAERFGLRREPVGHRAADDPAAHDHDPRRRHTRPFRVRSGAGF